MMPNSQIIKKIVSTWKSEQQRKNDNVYTFFVDPLANKFQLKEVLEKAFAVKIERISSLRKKPVLRNQRLNLRTKLRKKIFVKLKEGYMIGGEFSSEKSATRTANISTDNHKLETPESN